MEVAALALQQAQSQTNLAMNVLKKNAQAEQALVNMITQAAASGGRGQVVDVTV